MQLINLHWTTKRLLYNIVLSSTYNSLKEFFLFKTPDNLTEKEWIKRATTYGEYYQFSKNKKNDAIKYFWETVRVYNKKS